MPISNPVDAGPQIAAHAAIIEAHHAIPAVKTETRHLQAVAGDIAYTGYGFLPSALIIISICSANMGSIGCSDSGLNMIAIYNKSATAINESTTHIILLASATVGENALLKSYDADGFTLTWSLVGAGMDLTGEFIVFAFK